ncbi:MAG: transglycosylase SLT domain-containing protein [Spirochaetales bacterium]|nr:transglycosylase SLT domain-containing protein [Spirochaetales bacterium]
MYIIPLSYLGLGFTFSAFSKGSGVGSAAPAHENHIVLPVENYRSSRDHADADARSADLTLHGDTDLGLYFFRQELTRQRVVEFYAKVTGSKKVAALILEYAAKEDIPLPLAFSLAWAESGFNPKAVNANRTSVDRGLFQLNSRSFPGLSEEQFFDPKVNTATGLDYLRYCLDVGGNEVAGLAMYNAGRTRVTETGAPKMTLDYISKILKYADYLHDEFENRMDLIRLDGQNGPGAHGMAQVRYMIGGS